MGKKPLYYALSHGKLIFASELKALLFDKTISREIDLQALNHFLTFGYIGGDLCIYKSVKKLLPAHAMLYDVRDNSHKRWKYWDVPQFSGMTLSKNELLDELEAILTDAVRLRMKSDVPLGVFLSGGIDSSLVVAMMSRVSADPIKTFTVGFEEIHYDERPYARMIANHFKTDHHEIVVKPDSFSVLPQLVGQFDEPFADSSMIPTYYISKAIKDHVTVALSGDGGDELLGGYSSYLGTLWNYHIAQWIPSPFRKELARVAKWVPEKIRGRQQLLRLLHDPFDAFIDRSTYMFFDEFHRRSLLRDDIVDTLNQGFLDPELSRRAHLVRMTNDFINALTYADFKTYLPDDILVKVDRASMLVSLEVRSPLLDYRIADFSFKKIPGDLKVNRVTQKCLLKQLARKVLPRGFPLNRKMGFSIPLNEWFRVGLFADMRERFLEDRNLFFNKPYIEQLLLDHESGIDRSGRLFALLTFSIWSDRLS